MGGFDENTRGTMVHIPPWLQRGKFENVIEMLKTDPQLVLKASSNGVVLLNKQMQPIASRIFGVVPKELRSSKFLKLITLSGTTI